MVDMSTCWFTVYRSIQKTSWGLCHLITQKPPHVFAGCFLIRTSTLTRPLSLCLAKQWPWQLLIRTLAPSFFEAQWAAAYVSHHTCTKPSGGGAPRPRGALSDAFAKSEAGPGGKTPGETAWRWRQHKHKPGPYMTIEINRNHRSFDS